MPARPAAVVKRERGKYHAQNVALTAGLLVLVGIMFTISSAETKTELVCLGSNFNCQVSNVSPLGALCGTVGVIAMVSVVVNAFFWYALAPKD
jgi:hypothetical protein